MSKLPQSMIAEASNIVNSGQQLPGTLTVFMNRRGLAEDLCGGKRFVVCSPPPQANINRLNGGVTQLADC